MQGINKYTFDNFEVTKFNRKAFEKPKSVYGLKYFDIMRFILWQI